MHSPRFWRKKSRVSDKEHCVRVSVIGLSGKKDVIVESIGKSSLCSQFVASQHDKYSKSAGRHSSWISLGDTSSLQILNSHFLYHGKAVRFLTPPASSSPSGGRSRSLRLGVDVVEQTEFYDCDKQCRFLFGNRSYVDRAVATNLGSRGKIAYTDMDSLQDAASASSVRFPDAFWREGAQGFLLLYDPTLLDENKEIALAQDRLFDRLVNAAHRVRLPLVVAVTKCDLLYSGARDDRHRPFDDHPAVQHVRQLMMKKDLPPPVFCSSKENVNVDQAFLCLANLILKGKLDGFFPKEVYTYEAGIDVKRKQMTEARDAFQRLLGNIIDKANTTWAVTEPKLKDFESYATFVAIFGQSAPKKMFLARILRLVHLESLSTFVKCSSLPEAEQREKVEKAKRDMLQAHEDFR